MDQWIWDRFAAIADVRGDVHAIRQGEAAISFADLRHRAEAMAGGLPLRPGERAVVCAHNSIAFTALIGAIWRRGAIPVLVNADAPTTHLEHAARKTGAAAVFSVKQAEGIDAPLWPMPDLRAIDMAYAPAAPHGRTGQDAASIVFTSGSTGLPKGVVQRSATLIDGAARIGGALSYGETDSILCPIPFAFDYGWGQCLSMMTQGIALVLPELRNPFSLCAALEAHRPTVLAGVPAVFAELAFGLAPIAQTQRESIRLITSTGSKIPAPVFDQLDALFPAADISLNYGLTETYRSAMLPLPLARSHRHAVGHAAPGATLLILREDGMPTERGEAGEIIHVGAGVFDHYWDEPEATAKARFEMIDETGAAVAAVRTGDWGFIDEAGLLTIIGRRDRQIKCMGVRVSPDEVERILYDTGLLREVAITAAAHDMFGSLITAHVAVAPGEHTEKETLQALKKQARADMSAFMQPRAYVVHAALPRNANGKVDYLALEKMGS